MTDTVKQTSHENEETNVNYKGPKKPDDPVFQCGYTINMNTGKQTEWVTMEQLMDKVIEAIEELSPEKKAQARENLKARLLKKTPEKEAPKKK